MREWYTRIILFLKFAIASMGHGKFSVPISRPAAPGSQYGARRPENAVTKNTPPLSGTEVANVFISLADLMKPMESRNLTRTLKGCSKSRLASHHLMALPATPTTSGYHMCVVPKNQHAHYFLPAHRLGQPLDRVGKPPYKKLVKHGA